MGRHANLALDGFDRRPSSGLLGCSDDAVWHFGRRKVSLVSDLWRPNLSGQGRIVPFLLRRLCWLSIRQSRPFTSSEFCDFKNKNKKQRQNPSVWFFLPTVADCRQIDNLQRLHMAASRSARLEQGLFLVLDGPQKATG